eukprot:gene20973-23030_t
MAAKFGNRHYGSPIFYPNEGRVTESTPANVELALDNHLQVSFPWLSNSTTSHINGDVEGHPVTGKNVHLALFDRFHETNTKGNTESLRRIACVKELYGVVNSEAAEQLHGEYDLNMHFRNKMKPAMHVFIFRSIIDLKNEEANARRIKLFRDSTNMPLSLDCLGRLIFANGPNNKQVNTGPITSNDRTEQSVKSYDVSNVVTSAGNVNNFDADSYDVTSEGNVNSPDPDSCDVTTEGNVNNFDADSYDVTSEGNVNNPDADSRDVTTGGNVNNFDADSYDLTSGGNVNSPDADSGDVTTGGNVNNVDADSCDLTSGGNVNSPDADFREVIFANITGDNIAHNDNNAAITDRTLLSRQSIDTATILIRKINPKIGGLYFIEDDLKHVKGDFIQIIPLSSRDKNSTEWGVLSNVFSNKGHVTLYDSTIRLHYKHKTREVRYNVALEKYAATLYSGNADNLTIQVADVEQFKKDNHSGIAAIIHAIKLAKGLDPRSMKFNYKSLRRTLINDLSVNTFENIEKYHESPRHHKGHKYEIQVALYCTCRMPDLGTQMISCKSCEKWYHWECVGLSEENIAWSCNTCQTNSEPNESEENEEDSPS